MPQGNKPHTIQVHDGPVTVVEPAKSMLDLPLLLLYSILSLSLFFVSRYFLNSYGLLTPAPPAHPSPKAAAQQTTLEVRAAEKAEVKESKAVSDEYLPNLPKAGKRVNKKERARSAASATSGDDSEGAIRKGKKGKK